jgi:hypothetical protein
MDISVSRLNNRLALQLPTELPLGLVFVLGHVQNLTQTETDIDGQPTPTVTFDLLEKGHSIRCQLSPRAAADTALQEGYLIRAGGHLSFDPTQAEYFLFARDVEIVPEKPEAIAAEPQSRLEKTGLARVLTDVKKRSAAVKAVPSDMPVWVQRMAPPGLGVEAEADAQNSKETAAAPSPPPTADLPTIDQELVDFVDRALESDEEVELTPELLARLVPSSQTPSPSNRPTVVAEPPATATGSPTHPKQQMEKATTILLLTLIMLLIVLAATFLLLWLT